MVTTAVELWQGLSPEEHDQVAKVCPERRFPKGSTIFAPGAAPDALYVLKSGLVTLSHLSEGGQESILRVFGPGDVFGELFLTVPARPFLARALTACVVKVIPAKTFLHLLSTVPRIGIQFRLRPLEAPGRDGARPRGVQPQMVLRATCPHPLEAGRGPWGRGTWGNGHHPPPDSSDSRRHGRDEPR